HAMQQAALFVAMDRNVAVAVAQDRELGEEGVAVVAMRIGRIAAVGVLGPDAVGKEFVLRFGGPVGVPACVVRVRAQDFLQEHQVGGYLADRLAQRRQHEAAPRGAEAHVGIQREDVQGRHAAQVCRPGPARYVMGPRPRRSAIAGAAAAGTTAAWPPAARCAARSPATWAATARTRSGAVTAGLGAARTIAVGIECTGIGVVRGKARRIARMTVGMRGASLATATAAARTACIAARTAIA